MDKIIKIFYEEIMNCDNIDDLKKIDIANEYIHEKLLKFEECSNDKYIEKQPLYIIPSHKIVINVMHEFKSLYYHQYMETEYQKIHVMISYVMNNSIIKLDNQDRENIRKDIEICIDNINEVSIFCKKNDNDDHYHHHLYESLHDLYEKLYKKKYISKPKEIIYSVNSKKIYMVDYIDNISTIIDNIEKKYDVKYDKYINKIQCIISQIKLWHFYVNNKKL